MAGTPDSSRSEGESPPVVILVVIGTGDIGPRQCRATVADVVLSRIVRWRPRPSISKSPDTQSFVPASEVFRHHRWDPADFANGPTTRALREPKAVWTSVRAKKGVQERDFLLLPRSRIRS